MTYCKPLLNEEQWRFFDALKCEGKDESFVPMPGIRLEYWLSQQHFQDLLKQGALCDPRDLSKKPGSSKRMFESCFRNASVLISLVKVDSEGSSLGLAVCDDLFSAKLLLAAHVTVISWEEARLLPKGSRELIMLAIKALALRQSSVHVPLHREEAALKQEIAGALHIRWPDMLDQKNMDPDILKEIRNYITDQLRSIALFREVAISRFVGLNGKLAVSRDEQSMDEQSMYDTSSVDMLVCARPPLNKPILVVEYDGQLHWTEEKKIRNDKAKDSLFASIGLAILRIRTNEARAAQFQDRNSGCRYPVDPHLAPMLKIANAIVQKRVTELNRQKTLDKEWIDNWHQRKANSQAVFGKSYFDLNDDQRDRIDRTNRTGESWEETSSTMEYGWHIDDQLFEESTTLDGQLAAAGIPSDLFDDFAIVETPRGLIAKARMRIPGRATISIETVGITLRAPTLPPDEIKRLIVMQLYADFVDKAGRHFNANNNNTRKHLS